MSPRLKLSLGGFFSALHASLIIYILGPYLATLMPVAYTGLVISAGAILTLILFPIAPHIVERFGAKKLAMYGALLEIVVLLGIAITPLPYVAIALVALSAALSPLIFYQLDLLLEATIRQEGITSRVHAAYLTAGNIAYVVAPLIVGFLLDGTAVYSRMFFAAALSLVPFVILFLFNHIPEGRPPRFCDIRETAGCIIWDRDLRATVFASIVLQFFYHLAPLYVSLYMVEVLGMDWSVLGWMFMVMLIPFVLVEFPAGEAADRWFGDKEMMATGFVIMGISFTVIPFFDASTAIWFMLAILVATRIGAALSEAMIEGHFFRRVSEQDAPTISVFRMMRPIAALAAPICGTLLYLAGGYTALFVCSGLFVAFFGAISALLITDVK